MGVTVIRREYLLIGVILISSLMISSATAIPKLNSEAIIEQISVFD